MQDQTKQYTFVVRPGSLHFWPNTYLFVLGLWFWAHIWDVCLSRVCVCVWSMMDERLAEISTVVRDENDSIIFSYGQYNGQSPQTISHIHIGDKVAERPASIYETTTFSSIETDNQSGKLPISVVSMVRWLTEWYAMTWVNLKGYNI